MSTGTLVRGRAHPAPTPPIDPRLRARRVEVERRRARRRLRRLSVLLAVLALAGVAYGVSRSPMLDLDRVEVTGASGTAARDVRAAADLRTGTAMTDVDPGAVAARLRALPWVATAEVERQWPATVSITVTARTPVAVDRAGRGIDAQGRVVGPVGTTATADPLPELAIDAGEPGASVPAEHRPLLAVAEALPAELGPEVRSIATRTGEVHLTLRDGIEVRLGTTDRLTAKFVAIEALLDQAGRSTIDEIDVRVPTSPSLTRREGSGA